MLKPQGWEQLTLAECFETKQNNTLSRDCLNYQRGSFKNIHYGDVLTLFPYIVNVTDPSVPFINSDVKPAGDLLETGDVVFADTAEDLAVGRACEITGTESMQAVAGLHTIVLHPVDDRFISGYLGYYFNSVWFHSRLVPYAHGTKVISVSKNDFMKLPVLLPPQEEQRAIVEALQDIDTEITLLETTLEKTRNLKQGMMRELLTGRIRLVQE